MIVTDDLLRDFLAETGEQLDTVDTQLVRLEQRPDDGETVRVVFRLVHTVKGTCGFLGLPRLEALAHAAETLLGRIRDGGVPAAGCIPLVLATVDQIRRIVDDLGRDGTEPAGDDAALIARLERAACSAVRDGAEAPPRPDAALPASPPVAPQPSGTVRVALGTLDGLMATVSELVLTRNQLADILRRDTGLSVNLKGPLGRLSQIAAELQDGITRTRLQPIGSAWAKLPRLVRDLGRDLGKPMQLVLDGAATGVDRQVVEAVRDPLTQIIRNAASHGIEAPELRRRLGKPDTGTIAVRAGQQGSDIVIEVGDDGAGLHLAELRDRAVAAGFLSRAEADGLTDGEAARLIFRPGLSTARAVTAVSGRGVGMDIVATNVEAAGGSVEVETEPGAFTRIRLRIPLTLAIVGALVVEAGRHRFALPQGAIVEVVRLTGAGSRIERMNGASLLRLRGLLLPVVDLARILDAPPDPAEGGCVVVLDLGRGLFGLRVAALGETEDIVVKPLAARLGHLPAFSGSTILGDGSVVLILDPGGIARSLDMAGTKAVPSGTPAPGGRAEDRPSLLVFRGSGPVLKAVPLALVTRLEEADAATIAWVAGRPTIPYRGGLLPLVPVDADLRLRSAGPQPVIVFSDGTLSMGLAVAEIVDVVDADRAVEPVPGRPDLLGQSLVRGRPAEVLDISDYLPRAHGGAWSRDRDLSGAAGEVLLVDADPVFRDMLALVLRAGGHKVRTASGGAEALRLLSERPADAVAVDMDAPESGGLEILHMLRTLPGLAGTAAVALVSRLRTDTDAGLPCVTKFDRTGLLAAMSAVPRPSLKEAA